MARKARNSKSACYYLWINLYIDGPKLGPTDVDADIEYLRRYEAGEEEDREQNAEEEEGDDDFDWVKYDKECSERFAAKEAQSAEQKKAWVKIPSSLK